MIAARTPLPGRCAGWPLAENAIIDPSADTRLSEHYDLLQRLRPFGDVSAFSPNCWVGVRGRHYENGRVHRDQQIGNDFGTEKIVDRSGDTCGLRAEDRFHHSFDDRTKERDRAAFRFQKAVKEVRPADDLLIQVQMRDR